MNFIQEMLYSIHLILLGLATFGGVLGVLLVLNWIFGAVFKQ